MSDSTSGGAPSSSGATIPILGGAVLAIVAGSLYLFYQLNQVRDDLDQVRDQLAQTRTQLTAEIARVHENSTVSTQTSQSSVEALKTELDVARKQAQRLVGEAQVNATKHADEIAAHLERVQKIQQEQAQTVTAVNDAVSQVKTDADATKSKVVEVSTEVGSVRTELTAAKSDLDKTITDLKTTKGDLGIQSGLIATNAKELMALKAQGERNYFEFTLPKEKSPRKVGDIYIRLKAADLKRSRYTLELIIDDKVVEKKDKTMNEPVQFILSRAAQPYELVVNEVKKDMISGYLAAPKAAQARN